MPRRYSYRGTAGDDPGPDADDQAQALTRALHLLLPIRRQRLLRNERRQREFQLQLRQTIAATEKEDLRLAGQRRRYALLRDAFGGENVGRRQAVARLRQALARERVEQDQIAQAEGNLRQLAQERAALEDGLRLAREEARRRRRDVEKGELLLTQLLSQR